METKEQIPLLHYLQKIAYEACLSEMKKEISDRIISAPKFFLGDWVIAEGREEVGQVWGIKLNYPNPDVSTLGYAYIVQFHETDTAQVHTQNALTLTNKPSAPCSKETGLHALMQDS